MAKLTNPQPLSKENQDAFESIRAEHKLRPLTDEESGTGIEKLPEGVYGFTYSPATDNFPLFKERDLRCYEGHKLSDGRVFLLGFLTADEESTKDVAGTIHLFAEPKDDATAMASIPIARVARAVEHSQRGAAGLQLELS